MKTFLDESKIDENTETKLVIFPEIDKFCKIYINNLKKKNTSFVPSNATRINKNVREIIIKRRKLVDATDLSSDL